MWILVLVAVPAIAGAVLWFTVWAERRIVDPAEHALHAAEVRSEVDASPMEGSLAYVLLQTAPAHAHAVVSAASMLPWVHEAGLAKGPYDVIVRAVPGTAVGSQRDLVTIDGVLRVLPCRAGGVWQNLAAAATAGSPVSVGAERVVRLDGSARPTPEPSETAARADVKPRWRRIPEPRSA